MFRLSDFISQNQLNEFCRKHHIKKLSLFGSALRDNMKSNSDIDLLVEFDEEHIPGLLDRLRNPHPLGGVMGIG